VKLREFTLSGFKPETELSEPAGERLKSNLLKSQSDRKQVAFNFKPDLKKKRAASLTQDFFKRFRKAWIRRDLLLEESQDPLHVPRPPPPAQRGQGEGPSRQEAAQSLSWRTGKRPHGDRALLQGPDEAHQRDTRLQDAFLCQACWAKKAI